MTVKSDKTKKTTKPRRSGRRPGGSTSHKRFTADELDGFRQRLLDKRRTLLGDVGLIRSEITAEELGSVAVDPGPGDLADTSHSIAAFEAGAQLLELEASLLMEVEEALQRIDERSYGSCQATGKPISKARLKAIPWAKYCKEYARTLEENTVRPGTRPRRLDLHW